MCRSDRGFTLVEVIVASVILFSAISIGFLAARSALQASDRVTAYLSIADALPDIMDRVKTKLFDNQVTGEGDHDKWIRYSYVARPINKSRNLVDTYGGAAVFEYGLYDLTVYAVELAVNYKKNAAFKTMKYSYQELTWKQAVQ